MTTNGGIAPADGSARTRFSARRWLRRFAAAGGIWIVAEGTVTIGWHLTGTKQDEHVLAIWQELDATKRSAVLQSITERNR